jgi:anti-sigma factor RsiW
MNEAERNDLQAKILQFNLSPEEHARLKAHIAAHPELTADLHDDLALNQILEGLPDAPISSNFTGRVLQIVEWEQRKARRDQELSVWSWFRLNWARAAVAMSVVLGTALLSSHYYQERQRAELAHSVSQVTEVTSAVPSVDILRDFEAIRRLNQKSDVDYELLAMQ